MRGGQGVRPGAKKPVIKRGAVMWDKIRRDFDKGFERITWLSSVLSERLKVELSLIRFLGKIRSLEDRKAEIFKDIGMKVFQMSANSEIDVFNHPDVRDGIKEIEDIDAGISGIKKEAEELGSMED
jgi:hypothetical protein